MQDKMITMDVKTVFVGVCVALLIHGCCSQKITFNRPIHYNGPCGVSDGQGNWTTTGTVELKEVDRILFAPKLEIHTCSPTCSLDLTMCLPEESIPDTPGQCYCQKQSNGLLKVNIGAQADPAQSGLSVQASIPSYDNFGQITTSATLGIIPTIPEKQPPVKPTYQVDGGPLQLFLSVQTLTVCPNSFVTISICVEDKPQGSVLKVNLNRRNYTTDNTCLQEIQNFHFESTSTHKMVFSYKESNACTDSHISTLYIQEKKSGCQATTPLVTKPHTPEPSTPQTPEALTPQTPEPSTPQTPEALTPQTPEPSTPQTPEPSTPQTPEPSTPQTSEPSTPQTPEPSTPQTPEPSTPQTPEPSTPQTAVPTTQLPECLSPDVVKLLSPGMTQLCDNIDGREWTIIQKRTSGKVDFFRKWDDYEKGFGEQPDNYWLGLKAIHNLCFPSVCKLRFDLKFKGKSYYAQYDNFTVEGADTNYRMFVSGYHGNAGDNGKVDGSLGNGFMYHSGMSFSTTDKDHDNKSSGNCADDWRGAWWFNQCHVVHLNGVWGSTENGKGLNWRPLTGFRDSVTFSEMKVRQHN